MKLLLIFSLFITPLTLAIDHNHGTNIHKERGMTNLLGADTYMRCSKHLQNPDAKTYELSYMRTKSMPLSPLLEIMNQNFFPYHRCLIHYKFLQWMSLIVMLMMEIKELKWMHWGILVI